METINILAACAAATLLSAASGANAAVNLHQEFADLCLKTSSLQDAENAARAAGFAPATAELAKSAQALAPGEVLSRTVDGQTLIFITASAERRSSVTQRSLNADACLVGSKPVQAGVAEALKPLIGVGDLQRMSGEQAFVYEQQATKRVRVDTSNPRRAALISRRGALRMVMTTEQDGFSAVMLLKPVVSGP